MTLSPPSVFHYHETSEETVVNTRKFVEDVLAKRSELVKPIITPRFAVSLEMEDMKNLGAIAKEYNLHIQVLTQFFKPQEN